MPESAPEPASDAQERYEAAKGRRARILTEWETLGCPVTALGGSTGRTASAHPLLKALNDIDVLCARLERELVPPARAGRPVGAVSAPDRVAPPKIRRLRSA